MDQNTEVENGVIKFAGLEVPRDLRKVNFFFLFFNTVLIATLQAMPAIIQPAFLKDIIKVSPEFFGSINGLLQNMSQIATLAFVGMVGVLSDKVGRKILAVFGFIMLVIFFYLFGRSNEIAATLSIPSGLAANVCAGLLFTWSRASEFTQFAPSLFVLYVVRFIIGIGIILCVPQFITMVADYTYPKDRGKGMALNGIMFGLGSTIVFVVFAPIGRKSGVESLFMFSSIIALVGVIATWVFLKDRLPEIKNKKTGVREIFQVVNKSLALKASYLCCLITRSDAIVFATFLITWAVQISDNYNLTSGAATMKGSIPMIVLSIATLIAFPFAGVMLDRWGRAPTIITSLFCGGGGMLLISLCPNPFTALIYVPVVLAGFGMSGYLAGANTLASDASPKSMVGSILGGLNTMQPIGVLFFLAAGGYVFDVLGPGWVFALKGAANIILGIWMFTVRKRIKFESTMIQREVNNT
jgi:MFS family permease